MGHNEFHTPHEDRPPPEIAWRRAVRPDPDRRGVLKIWSARKKRRTFGGRPSETTRRSGTVGVAVARKDHRNEEDRT